MRRLFFRVTAEVAPYVAPQPSPHHVLGAPQSAALGVPRGGGALRCGRAHRLTSACNQRSFTTTSWLPRSSDLDLFLLSDDACEWSTPWCSAEMAAPGAGGSGSDGAVDDSADDFSSVVAGCAGKGVATDAQRGDPRAFDREQLRDVGRTMLIGADEAGRGPIYGPVVGGACWLAPSVTLQVRRSGGGTSAASASAAGEAAITAPPAAATVAGTRAAKSALRGERDASVGDSKKTTQAKREILFTRLTGIPATPEAFFATYDAAVASAKGRSSSGVAAKEAPAGPHPVPPKVVVSVHPALSTATTAATAAAATPVAAIELLPMKELLQQRVPWLATISGSTSLGSDAAVDVRWSISLASAALIDAHNILAASLRAMGTACCGVASEASCAGHGSGRDVLCLVDGNQLPPADVAPPRALQAAVVRGDDRSFAIGAASILAKVGRDLLMRYLGTQVHRGYGIEDHQGYPTKAHMEALWRRGVTPLHRASYSPCRNVLRVHALKRQKKEENLKKGIQRGKGSKSVRCSSSRQKRISRQPKKSLLKKKKSKNQQRTDRQSRAGGALHAKPQSRAQAMSRQKIKKGSSSSKAPSPKRGTRRV